MVASAEGDPVSAGPHKLFGEVDAGDFSILRFRRHYQNQVLENRGGDVGLVYPDGSAALTISAVGGGTAAFVNLPLTPDGGDFIGSPLFPATLHELLRALRRGSADREVAPGAAWMLDVPTRGEGAITVTDPDGHPIEAQIISSGRTTRLALAGARMPGACTIKQANEIVGCAAINIDPRESDTRPIALENLKAGDGAAVMVASGEEDLLIAGKNRPLWPQLAAATALFLGLEMLLLALWRRTATPLRQRPDGTARWSSGNERDRTPAPANDPAEVAP
jgi:hypothetical protein